MGKFKFLSILIVCLFMFNTVSYADEKIHIPSNVESSTTVEQESASVEISDVMIEGMKKNYDEELGADVFTSKEASVMELEGSSEDLIELVDYDVEKIEKFENQPQNRPDNYFEYQENEMSVLANTTTDLVAHGLAVNGEIKSGQKASFYYYLTNYGSESLTNVDFEIRVNGKILETLPISGTVAANTQYRIAFNLNGLSAGQYELVVNVDPNNKINEVTKINNVAALNFYIQDGVPDLTAEITSPTTAKLPGVEEGSASQRFNVRIENIGTGYSPTNVFVQFYADNKAITGLYINQPLAPNSGGNVEFNLLFSVYKPTEIKVIIDPNNSVTETNKSNNSHARTYEPNFCLHPWLGYLKETGDISVQVANTSFFGNVDRSVFEDRLGAWNGITDKLEVVEATVTNTEDLLAGYNVLIKGDKIPDGAPSNTRAETFLKGVNQAPRTRIELYTNSTMATSNRIDNVRTIIHDQYGIYTLHEKGTKTLSVEPKMTEDSGECQLFSRYPIEVYSLDELEGYAQYIVKGRILDEGENMNLEGTKYTRTGFEISDVYKGDLEAGETIYLKESYFQEDVLGTDYTFYRNGYTKSIVNDEYIFFLIKDPDFEEYGVVMASLSRYNLSANDTIGEDVDNQSSKKVFTAENHSKIKEEVLLKYQ